jgi:hypothetical protein
MAGLSKSRSLVEHREFLDLSGDPPMRALAEQFALFFK